MRRINQKITDFAAILSILSSCEVLHLALSENNMPYILPMNFGFESENEQLTLYLHSASKGKKLDIIESNNNVCFEGVSQSKIIPHSKPEAWTTHYDSIIGFGKIQVLSLESEKIAGLNSIMKQSGYKRTPIYSPEALGAVAVLKITVTSITGKSNPKL